MWNNRCQNGRICVSGVEVLSYRISLPEWTEFAEVSAAYGGIAERAIAFCETQLRERAEGEFEASEDPQKRFRFPAYRYRLEGRVTYEDGAREIASVCLTAELKRRGETACLERNVEVHTWKLSEALLLPPEQTAVLWEPALRLPKKMRRRGDLLLEGNRLFWIYGAEKQELFAERTVSRKHFFSKKAK